MSLEGDHRLGSTASLQRNPKSGISGLILSWLLLFPRKSGGARAEKFRLLCEQGHPAGLPSSLLLQSPLSCPFSCGQVIQGLLTSSVSPGLPEVALYPSIPPTSSSKQGTAFFVALSRAVFLPICNPTIQFRDKFSLLPL